MLHANKQTAVCEEFRPPSTTSLKLLPISSSINGSHSTITQAGLVDIVNTRGRSSDHLRASHQTRVRLLPAPGRCSFRATKRAAGGMLRLLDLVPKHRSISRRRSGCLSPAGADTARIFSVRVEVLHRGTQETSAGCQGASPGSGTGRAVSHVVEAGKDQGRAAAR